MIHLTHPATRAAAPTGAALLADLLPRDRRSLGWAEALCSGGTIRSITDSGATARATARREITALMDRCGTSLRPQITAQYTAADLVPAHCLPREVTDPWNLDPADRALLRLLARMSHSEAAAELALTQDTVSSRAARLRRLLHVATDHEATALGAMRGLVRPGDTRPGLPLPAPDLPDALAPAVRAVLARLAATSHATAQIPRAEQQVVAAAVAHARAGHRSRVLVVADDGPGWDCAMDTWAGARRDEGSVVGLRHRPVHPTDDERALAWTRRGLLDLAGTRRPVTVVATPESLDLLTALHHAPRHPLTRWDLIVTVDAHRPANTGHRSPGAAADPALPAAARLALTAAHTPVPLISTATAVRRSVALAGGQGRVRGHRLLAVPWTVSATPDEVAAVVLEAARRHGLRRVQVVCGSATTCQQLVDAVARAGEALPGWRRPVSSWTGTITPDLPAGERAQVLQSFAEGHEELLVLAASGPVRAAGADALLHLVPHDGAAAGEAVEWALETRDPRDSARTLAVLVPVPDESTPGSGTGRAEEVLRVCAALDPSLADRAQGHPAGSRWPWIDGAPYLDSGRRSHLDAAVRALTTGQPS
ncbi:AsnC family protein [Kitasatospora sp. MBT66]|uniref:AsnC family protein n=1 Tax=Kitasatospora sp. MBT66 TaxID=1444769 RepID=UPI0005BBF32D|nr:AsnC family protein [Kitasatospora sp. MBT66]